MSAWTIALLLAVWSIGRGARLAHEQWRNGSGFAHRQWRESETLGALRELVSRETWIYTNAPGAMYLLTGRPSIIALPSKFSASSMRENPKYAGQLRRMREDVAAGRAVVVYLRRYARGRQRYNPTEAELLGPVGLAVLARGNDGAIYHDASTTTRPASASLPTVPAPPAEGAE
jgi:hypothetical protein